MAVRAVGLESSWAADFSAAEGAAINLPPGTVLDGARSPGNP